MHVAIIEDFEECLVSNTELGLRGQVIETLAKKFIAAPSDEEWSDCVQSAKPGDSETDYLSLSMISYYKTESHLGAMEISPGKVIPLN